MTELKILRSAICSDKTLKLAASCARGYTAEIPHEFTTLTSVKAILFNKYYASVEVHLVDINCL